MSTVQEGVTSTGRRTSPCAASFQLRPDDTSRRYAIASPQNMLRCDGLWLWGADKTTLIHSIKIGNVCQFSVVHTPIPGLFFEAGMTFEKFNEIIDGQDGPLHLLSAYPKIHPHQRIGNGVCEIGNQLYLDIYGPLTHAVIWGVTIR